MQCHIRTIFDRGEENEGGVVVKIPRASTVWIVYPVFTLKLNVFLVSRHFDEQLVGLNKISFSNRDLSRRCRF